MKFVTREEMRRIDREAVDRYGIPVDTLMGNAGKAVADVVAQRISPACPIVAVCGRGNNGGDGFVAARILADRGFTVEVWAMEPEYDPATPTGRNWIRVRDRLEFVRGFKRRPMATIVDALLGTGLARTVEGKERRIIGEMNALDRPCFPIVAVDIPSGLDADTGEPLGVAVRAAATVAMGLPKAGFRNPAAGRYVGELIVADIGLPAELVPREARG